MAEAGVTVGELLFAPYADTPLEACKFIERLGPRLQVQRAFT
jgi:hypothetical protein